MTRFVKITLSQAVERKNRLLAESERARARIEAIDAEIAQRFEKLLEERKQLRKRRDRICQEVNHLNARTINKIHSES